VKKGRRKEKKRTHSHLGKIIVTSGGTEKIVTGGYVGKRKIVGSQWELPRRKENQKF